MWIKSLLLALSVALLGCQEKQVVTIDTQGQSEVSIEANQYDVRVVFKGLGDSADDSSKRLSELLSPFEGWANQQNFLLDAGRHDNRPQYHYHPQEGRKLVGYEAYQEMNIRGLSFEDYQLVISHVPSYNPDSLNLASVSAGEDQKRQAKSQLVDEAFAEAQLKAQAMAKTANLCGLTVVHMEENIQSGGGPRMMKMEMASSSLHQTQSQESLNLVLNAQWQAAPCQ